MKKPDTLQSAVALAYLGGNAAPKVVAKGRGILAEAIIEKARQAGVFVHESPALVSLLMQVDLDQHIPPELYRAVAELLAWLYQVERISLKHLDAEAVLPLPADKEPGERPD